MGRFDKLMKILGLVGEETPNLVKKLTQEETDALIRAWAEKKVYLHINLQVSYKSHQRH